MKQRRIYYSAALRPSGPAAQRPSGPAAQRSEIWDRWQAGEPMSSIGRRFDRESSSLLCDLANGWHPASGSVPSQTGDQPF